jgi:hypothetical protein
MNNVTTNQPETSSKSIFEAALREKLHAKTDSQDRVSVSHQRNNLVAETRAREVVHSIIKSAYTGKHNMGIFPKLLRI